MSHESGKKAQNTSICHHHCQRDVDGHDTYNENEILIKTTIVSTL